MKQKQEQIKLEEDTEFQDLIGEYLKISEKESNNVWKKGDLACKVEVKYGNKSLQIYSEKVDEIYRTLRAYKEVSEFYEFVTRVTNLSWRHHWIAKSTEDPQKWLKLAEKNKWSTRKLKEEIDKIPKFEEDEMPLESKYKVKLGEIWKLGENLLLCGDGTKEEDIKKLVDKPVDMILTDPPYNVGYEYENYDDNKTPEEYKRFCEKWFNLAKKYSKFQVITPGTVNLVMWAHIEKWKSIAPWIKNNSMNGGEISHLRIWEPIIFYGTPKKRRPTDLFEATVGQPEMKFGCPKPLNLYADIIASFKATTVLDLFGGSGTSLIVCQDLYKDFKTKCYMIELDTVYCGLIIERWEKRTGKKAEKL